MSEGVPDAIAIVGSGPAGLYAADAIVRQRPDARIDVYERLPTPFGLIRSGVAPDHPGTKAVARQFERLLARPHIRLRGNVEIGRDLSLRELRDAYRWVIVASGAGQDRALGVAGEHLPGVHGSGAFVGWYNGHPDHSSSNPPLGPRIAVIGNGNVALDIVRILARAPETLTDTDISTRALAQLKTQRVREILLVGRRGPEAVKFSPLGLTEVAAIPGVRLMIDGPVRAAVNADAGDAKILAQLAALPHAPDATPQRVRIRLMFNTTPIAIEGEARVSSVMLEERTETVSRQRVNVDAIVTAIGYRAHTISGLPPIQPQQAAATSGQLEMGLHVVGWAKRGASGTIATNRAEAQAVVRGALATTPPAPTVTTAAIDALLRERGVQVVDYAGWRAIDAAERVGTRIRKLLDREQLLVAACGNFDTSCIPCAF